MALADRVQSLAASLADIERDTSGGSPEEVEAEIERLEGAANPLDHQGSEERVRRLAYLKRQRRALADLATRRHSAQEKLETCSEALNNMRLELIRLRAGSQTHQHITSLAMQAVHLADSVDGALYVAEELGRSRAPVSATGGRRAARGAGARSAVGGGGRPPARARRERGRRPLPRRGRAGAEWDARGLARHGPPTAPGGRRQSPAARARVQRGGAR